MDYLSGGVGFGSGLDWDMTSNQGLTPLVNYNFNLQVEGIYNLPCKSVRVFQRENEYEILQEGGLNDYVHMLRKPISKPFTFQVERYVGIDMLDPLALGTDLALPVILMVSRYQGEGENGVLDLSDSMQRMYTFTGCTVMSKEYGELNAERSGLLVETTTIAYREMLCIDNPSTLSKRKTWSLKKDYKNMERDAERKEAKLQMGVTELTKEEMEEKAKMYVDKKVKEVPMHVLNYKGTKVSTTRNAKTHQNEIGIATKNQMASKEEMEHAAKRYFIPGSVSKSTHKGIAKQSAQRNKDELTKKEMEKKATMYVDNKVPEEKRTEFVKKYKGKSSDSIAAKMTMKPTEGQKRYDGTNDTKSAKTNEMDSQGKMEQAAKRYFLPGSVSKSTYQGTEKQSAQRNTDELTKTQMETQATMYVDKKVPEDKRTEFVKNYKGKSSDGIAAKMTMKPTEGQRRYDGTDDTRSADTQAMTPRTELETKARGYYLPGSQSVAQYMGTVKTSAAVNEAEVRKEQMPKRQGGAITKEMKRPDPRQGGAITKEMKRPEARQGGATTKVMKPTENQRRYFINGSKSRNSYVGTVRQSATVNENEVRKATMQSMARQWPKTRSAADVAAFLKKK
ncbi:MAG: hypothetical protein PUK75_03490 [bacterium]|nr:hypothetical protein [bacterium]MDY4098730.1 hypothetical protein [Lachnospiraceae bacterium]